MITPYDCVVVANGSFPQTTWPLELLKNTPLSLPATGLYKICMNGD